MCVTLCAMGSHADLQETPRRHRRHDEGAVDRRLLRRGRRRDRRPGGAGVRRRTNSGAAASASATPGGLLRVTRGQAKPDDMVAAPSSALARQGRVRRGSARRPAVRAEDRRPGLSGRPVSSSPLIDARGTRWCSRRRRLAIWSSHSPTRWAWTRCSAARRRSSTAG